VAAQLTTTTVQSLIPHHVYPHSQWSCLINELPDPASPFCLAHTCLFPHYAPPPLLGLKRWGFLPKVHCSLYSPNATSEFPPLTPELLDLFPSYDPSSPSLPLQMPFWLLLISWHNLPPGVVRVKSKSGQGPTSLPVRLQLGPSLGSCKPIYHPSTCSELTAHRT
jgi:hypothetical protein